MEMSGLRYTVYKKHAKLTQDKRGEWVAKFIFSRRL